MPASLLPILLLTHIGLALTLFLPQLLLPFALRPSRAAVESGSPIVRGLVVLQTNGVLGIGIGVVITGIALVIAVGTTLMRQPWLLVGITIYALNLVIAFFIQRPHLRRLLGVTATAGDRAWVALARRQRYVSYVMAAMIGTIGFLMSAKPQLW